MESLLGASPASFRGQSSLRRSGTREVTITAKGRAPAETHLSFPTALGQLTAREPDDDGRHNDPLQQRAQSYVHHGHHGHRRSIDLSPENMRAQVLEDDRD